MNQTGCVTPRSQNVCTPFFLADVTLADVLNLNPRLNTDWMGSLTNSVTQRFRKLRGVKNTNVLLLQKTRHSLRVACTRQRAHDHDSIKTGQHPMQIRRVPFNQIFDPHDCLHAHSSGSHRNPCLVPARPA
jgi:hypothetical protein